VAQAATSGAIKVWVKPAQNGTTTPKHPGKVLFTGAIGDYGTSVSVNAQGKAKKKGEYKLLKLTKGSILVNGSALDLTAATPTVNSSNCSFTVSATAAIPIVKGTGAYAGITGSVTFTASFGAILPKKKSGSGCTESTSAKLLAESTEFSGTGTVNLP
jgi:hypothetical protein